MSKSEKQKLILETELRYIDFVNTLDNLDESLRKESFPFDEKTGEEAHWMRDKNTKDLVIHIHEWQKLLLSWIKNNLKSKNVELLPEAYDWSMKDAFNEQICEDHKDTSYDEALKLVSQSHKKLIKQIQSFTECQLFSEDAYVWTKHVPLSSYITAMSSTHYIWAIKKIKKYESIVYGTEYLY